MQNVHLLLHLFASLCHILYFDAAKFSIKLFQLNIYSLVYLGLFEEVVHIPLFLGDFPGGISVGTGTRGRKNRNTTRPVLGVTHYF